MSGIYEFAEDEVYVDAGAARGDSVPNSFGEWMVNIRKYMRQHYEEVDWETVCSATL